jgi:fructuronate reductase
VPAAYPPGGTPSIAHLGVGVFHRAHQAVYAQDLLDAGWASGAQIGVAMHDPTIRDVLDAQDGLFAVGVLQGNGVAACRVVGSIREMRVLAERPEDTVTRLSDPAIRTVTMTITEAGYHWSTSSAALDETSEAIRADLEDPSRPRTMPGLLTAVAARRQAERVAPLTVVSCDNLVSNGVLCRMVVTQFAALLDTRLAESIAHDTAFCSSMVDRMVPAATPERRAAISEHIGLDDRAAVATEPFSQWVVEASPGARLPPWADVGVDIVADVKPFEDLKLRIVNATHTAIAALGAARGHETIAAAYNDPPIRAFVGAVVDEELLPSIPRPCPVDIDSYVGSTLTRFADPSLGYTNRKVLTGSAEKIPQRIVPVLRANVDHGRSIQRLSFVIASWLWTIAGPQPRLGDDRVGQWIATRVPDRSDPDAVTTAFLDPSGAGAAVLVDLLAEVRVTGAVQRAARAVWRDPESALLEQAAPS